MKSSIAWAQPTAQDAVWKNIEKFIILRLQVINVNYGLFLKHTSKRSPLVLLQVDGLTVAGHNDNKIQNILIKLVSAQFKRQELDELVYLFVKPGYFICQRKYAYNCMPLPITIRADLKSQSIVPYLQANRRCLEGNKVMTEIFCSSNRKDSSEYVAL